MRNQLRILNGASTSLMSLLLTLACSSYGVGGAAPPEEPPFLEASGGRATGPSFTDLRPAVIADRPPPPVSGGTLLALSDGQRALVSDPDRDRVLLVDYVSQEVKGLVSLEVGAQPTRLVEDGAAHAYVILRGTGDVLTIDLATANAAERRHVCIAPRGISLSPARDKLLVSCAEGRIVELPFSGPAEKETSIPLDARDVVVQSGRVLVSRFRASELVEVTSEGTAPLKLPAVSGVISDPLLGAKQAAFEPGVAWRTALDPNGHSVVMVHQRATTTEITLPHDDQERPPENVKPGLPGEPSAYGGDPSGCGGIVQSAITVMQDGDTRTSPQLAGVVLPVDVAVSGDGYIAVAGAGTSDSSISSSASTRTPVTFFTIDLLDRDQVGDCVTGTTVSGLNQPVVGVAFEPGETGRALALTRDPMTLYVINGFRSQFAFVERSFELPGASVTHTGHEVFHRDAGGGIACASCHPEGTDDGRTWNFSPIGARRTQPVDIGLEGTAPFHWDGDLPTLSSLMSEVFVRRMGGVTESPGRMNAIEAWVFSLRPRAALRSPDHPAARRGAALFTSSEVGCSTCHGGSKFTSASSFDVGTGGKFQVPSLLGVAQRLPLLHTGCATTLRERFNPSCGGSAHGNTAQLGEDQLSDLVAYLESI